ncbi:MAG: hypothetical protein ACJATA_000302 [Sphingobacteriales bacterium]|jgi:hypothetical protein
MTNELKTFSENLDEKMSFTMEFPKNLWSVLKSVLSRNKNKILIA